MLYLLRYALQWSRQAHSMAAVFKNVCDSDAPFQTQACVICAACVSSMKVATFSAILFCFCPSIYTLLHIIILQERSQYLVQSLHYT